MAHNAPDSPLGDAKFSSEMNAAAGDGLAQQEAGMARHEDYDVETVEKVYRCGITDNDPKRKVIH